MLQQLLLIVIFSFIYYLQLDTIEEKASKSLVVLLESGKKHSAIVASTKLGETTVDKVGAYVTLEKNKAPSKVKIMPEDELKKRFGDILKSAPMDPASYILYLKSKKLELTEESKKRLPQVFQAIKERLPCVVDIIGHTDTVGSKELNKKLSKERAEAIKELIAQQNFKNIIINTKGYGEEDLQVETPDNTDEAKNRNIEIFIK